MAKTKKATSGEGQEREHILGHDPFEGLDTEWLKQEEGALPIEVLGHDPFEDVDLEWIKEEGEASTGLRWESIAGEPAPVVTPAGTRETEQFAPAQITVEKLGTIPAQTEIETPLPPEQPMRPLVRGVAVSPARPRPEATFHFPADFKWGVAVAAYQVEGDNVNSDWWAWEQEPGRIKEGHTSGRACDWWRNAEADLDRAAGLGLNALRLSVEWSRIEPRPGTFDDRALERYAQILRGLRERGIEPMVTLHHFSNPRWLAERGGWEAPETVPLFARFGRRVVESLGRYCNLWCTINEPNIYAFLGYLEGRFPPGKSDLSAALRVMRNLLKGHAVAYRQIHAIQPDARVGFAHHMRVLDPVNARSWLDRRTARLTDFIFNQVILDALTGGVWKPPLGFGLALGLRRTLDWIGLNYYTRDMIAFDRSQAQTMFSRHQRSEGAELLDGDYGEFYPRGIFRCLQRLARLGLPIYITENGIPDSDDDQRPRYILTHLHQVWRAIQLCYPVMGYYHWTLVDNFEWAEGWTLRFGLIELDPATQRRRPRPSASLYADIARANAITPQIIDAYAPELRPELLPG